MRTRGFVRVEGNLIPVWIDHGPGYARVAGHSGSMVTGTSTKEGEREAQRRRDKGKRDAA